MLSNYELTIANKTLSVETGKLAKKANGSATLRYGDSIILVTATESAARPGLDFFPLTIDFEERMYARGKIPGSFFKREGRPSTDAILICRLTDRPLRPLFPKGFRNEVQIITTPLSADLENPLDILSINGASLALTISDIPFDGPLGATRMGYIDGDFVINPTFEQIAESSLDLIVAGTRDGVMMMESGANQLDEDLVYDAIVKAQEENLKLVEFQEKIAADIGKEKTEFVPPQPTEGIGDEVSAIIGDRLQKAVEHSISPEKDTSQIDALKIEATEKLVDKYESAEIGNVIENLTDEIYRSKMMDGVRPDGRGPLDLRPLSAEVGIVPRAHGTGLFERGETQALGVVTLGSLGDVQKIDNINPASTKRFLLHYNFPPYSVGEVGRVGSPKRREIGHGALAERALTAVLPGEEDCPYTIRVVTEIMSSNGSTSMASVCSSSLALMDAGVPIKAPIAGVAMGLIMEDENNYAILTDILGTEDHLGDMDFKVAGSRDGITAIQMDLKIDGLPIDLMREALQQAKEGRIHILDVMKEELETHRDYLSIHAPKIGQSSIPVDRIGDFIGPGGKNIKAISAEYECEISVEDDGMCVVMGQNQDYIDTVVRLLDSYNLVPVPGEVYDAEVVRIMDFGAFVKIAPGKEGLVHISALNWEHVKKVDDVVKIGDKVKVKLIKIDDLKRLDFSMKALMEKPDNYSHPENKKKYQKS